MTTGQQFAATIRKSFGMSTRTRNSRDGGNLKAEILESIANAVQYPGFYGEERTALSRAAWGAYLSYAKHVEGYRVDGMVRYQIDQMSPWHFAGLIGDMIDAGVSNAGEGEAFFQNMARQAVAA